MPSYSCTVHTPHKYGSTLKINHSHICKRSASHIQYLTLNQSLWATDWLYIHTYLYGSPLLLLCKYSQASSAQYYIMKIVGYIYGSGGLLFTKFRVSWSHLSLFQKSHSPWHYYGIYVHTCTLFPLCMQNFVQLSVFMNALPHFKHLIFPHTCTLGPMAASYTMCSTLYGPGALLRFQLDIQTPNVSWTLSNDMALIELVRRFVHACGYIYLSHLTHSAVRSFYL